MKRLVQLFFAIILIAMLAITTRASFDRSVLEAGPEIWADPWGKATLIDTYSAFLVCFLWMAWRERSWAMRLLWLPLVLGLGSIAIAIYFLIALAQVGDGRWTDIFRRKADLDAERNATAETA
ncbi:MAG: DUF1475 family protein [Acidobacteriota bacterium]